MKTIFRHMNVGLLVAAILALGAVAGFGQNPCEDAAGINALDAKFRELYAKTDLESKKLTIDTGKQFLEKYGSCPSTKEFSDYLNEWVPKLEADYRTAVDADAEKKLVTRFNTALNSKSWDEVYTAGKEILEKYPDKFRDVELALGSIGYDESYKGNFKYNDDSLKYAKMALADLESGKTFSANYGVPKDFVYKSKDNAISWMNLIIGYITHVGKKNKKDALPYLYKASQGSAETKKNPIPYELIGSYYFDELDKLTAEIKALAADQKETDTEEVAKQKVETIKAKVALANGTAERAMDAFSRAYSLGQTPAYKTKMKQNVEGAYKLRFAKTEGVDAWMASVGSKPFPDPLSPIQPISDTEPSTAASGTAAPAATKPAEPATSKPAAPAAATKPVSGTKPAAVARKAVKSVG